MNREQMAESRASCGECQEPTARPWELDEDNPYMEGYERDIPHYRIVGEIGGISQRTVADVGGWKDRPNGPEDAAHIVRCVNSHDALVEALKVSRQNVVYGGQTTRKALLQIIDDALSLATAH